jgi:predicted dehydrogenase
LKVGIVGIGNMGSKYVNKFKELNLDYVLIDSNPEQLSKFPDDVKKFQDIEKALSEDLDAVFVATSPQSHLPIARKFLDAGINVMVEKPPSLSRKELEETLELAYKKNVYLSVSEIELKSSPIRNLSLDKNVNFVEGYRLNLGKGYINPFFDLAWHDLYIFHYLFGNFKIKDVKVEDNIAKVKAESENTEFDLQVAWLNPFTRREWILKTSDGDLVLNFAEDKIIYPSGEVKEKDNKDKLKLMIEEFLNKPSYDSTLRSINILKEIEKIKI